MSGHNKWSKIKHKKAVTDARKSKVFSKHVRSIQVESRRCGGDLNDPGLRAVIDSARRDNVPKDNIDRAVKKGAGGDDGGLEKIVYEAFAQGGVALIIEALTSNRNKAAAEVRHILSKHAGSVVPIGGATWAFSKENEEWRPDQTVSLDDKQSLSLEKLIDELLDNDEVQNVYSNEE